MLSGDLLQSRWICRRHGQRLLMRSVVIDFLDVRSGCVARRRRHDLHYIRNRRNLGNRGNLFGYRCQQLPDVFMTIVWDPAIAAPFADGLRADAEGLGNRHHPQPIDGINAKRLGSIGMSRIAHGARLHYDYRQGGARRPVQDLLLPLDDGSSSAFLERVVVRMALHFSLERRVHAFCQGDDAGCCPHGHPNWVRSGQHWTEMTTFSVDDSGQAGR